MRRSGEPLATFCPFDPTNMGRQENAAFLLEKSSTTTPSFTLAKPTLRVSFSSLFHLFL